MHATTLNDRIEPSDACAESEDIAPLALLFNELSRQDWPVLLLERRLPQLLAHASSLSPEDRCAWLSGLHRIWQRHGWALTPDGKEALLQLASAWCAWPLAYAVGKSLQTDSPLDGGHALRMMNACRHLGDGDTAVDLAVRAQLLHPADQSYADAHRELLAWLRWRDGMPVVDGADWDDDEIKLEPLAHHHLADFAWQYYDPAIAELCCLPRFQDDTHWRRWLDDIYDAGDQRIFAVMHRDWGLVGSVSLIMHGSAGFIYYWLGCDFQGCGLGPRAVSLMLAMAQHDYGMQCCYAKVYDYNTPSRRALEKLGFEDLGICGAVPDDNQLFYRYGESRPMDVVVNELHLLLACMESDTRAAAPLALLHNMSPAVCCLSGNDSVLPTNTKQEQCGNNTMFGTCI